VVSELVHTRLARHSSAYIFDSVVSSVSVAICLEFLNEVVYAVVVSS
jgi:hypothetical protein